MAEYICTDCGQRFEKLGMHGHDCPDPGSMKRLQASIDACLDCKMHPQGDLCPDHYDQRRKHPFHAYARRLRSSGSGA